MLLLQSQLQNEAYIRRTGDVGPDDKAATPELGPPRLSIGTNLALIQKGNLSVATIF